MKDKWKTNEGQMQTNDYHQIREEMYEPILLKISPIDI